VTFVLGQEVKMVSNQTDCWLPGDIAVVTAVPEHKKWIGVSLNGERYAVSPCEISAYKKEHTLADPKG